MKASEQTPLKIGYLWQQNGADLTKLSASVLHIKAVIRGFEQRGHCVRMVTMPGGQHQWSEDLVHWTPARPGFSQSRGFRTLESPLRWVQSRLNFPYLNLFESIRFAEACVSALSGFNLLYERYWLLNYGGLIAAKRLGIPLILEINGDLVEEYNQQGIYLSRFQWAAVRLLNRWLFKNATHIVTVSEVLRRRTADRWQLDLAKISTVSNGAHVEQFANPNKLQAGTLKSEGIGGPIVMFAGSFRPWHHLDLLLEAFAIVASKNREAKLILVGDGPLRSELQSQVRALNLEGRVLFPGRIPHPELPSVLALAQVLVLSHRSSPAAISTCPMKLFEYMAAGKAIVAPALPNIEEVLVHKKTGFLVPPDNPAALADALIRLLTDGELRSSLGHTAQQQALESHSWARTVQRLESIMYNLLVASDQEAFAY